MTLLSGQQMETRKFTVPRYLFLKTTKILKKLSHGTVKAEK